MASNDGGRTATQAKRTSAPAGVRDSRPAAPTGARATAPRQRATARGGGAARVSSSRTTSGATTGGARHDRAAPSRAPATRPTPRPAGTRAAGTRAAAAAAAARDGHPSERRMVRFDWSGTPAHWVPGDPFTSHVINVLHLLLPPGERWFIRVVKEALPHVKDPAVREAVEPFVLQESWHAWAHRVVLDHLADKGVDTEPFTEALERYLQRFGSDIPSLPEPARRLWLLQRLAAVAAIEHFTAVLGQWVLQTQGLDNAGADPVMLDLLRWHGAEEVEHRSLVFDVFDDLSGGYATRALAMLFAAPALTWWWVRGVQYLMARDPATGGARPKWPDWLRSARQFRLPGPWTLLVTTPLRYLRPGHHPSGEASSDLAAAYLSRSPAATAARAAGAA